MLKFLFAFSLIFFFSSILFFAHLDFVYASSYGETGEECLNKKEGDNCSYIDPFILDEHQWVKSGTCQKNPSSGKLLCHRPGSGWSMKSGSCYNDADCFNLACHPIKNVCYEPCEEEVNKPRNSSCSRLGECCEGLDCTNGICKPWSGESGSIVMTTICQMPNGGKVCKNSCPDPRSYYSCPNNSTTTNGNTTTSGGLVPCSGVDCNFCHFLELARRVFKFALELIVVAAIIFILIGAILLATHGGSEQRFTLGKDILTSVVIGIIIAFAAWIIINSFFGMLTAGENFVNLSNPWYDLKCEYTAPPPAPPVPASKYRCDKVDLNGNGKIDIGEGSCNPDPNGPYASYNACIADGCPVGALEKCGANKEYTCYSGASCPSGTSEQDPGSNSCPANYKCCGVTDWKAAAIAACKPLCGLFNENNAPYCTNSGQTVSYQSLVQTCTSGNLINVTQNGIPVNNSSRTCPWMLNGVFNKLQDIKQYIILSEGIPPFVNHESGCHCTGYCLDVKARGGKTLAELKQLLEARGFQVLDEGTWLHINI